MSQQNRSQLPSENALNERLYEVVRKYNELARLARASCSKARYKELEKLKSEAFSIQTIQQNRGSDAV